MSSDPQRKSMKSPPNVDSPPKTAEYAAPATPQSAQPPQKAHQPIDSEGLLNSLVVANSPYRYAFSMCCDLDESTQALHEVTGGVRKQVNYLAPFSGETKWSDGQTRPNVSTSRMVLIDRRVKWNGGPLVVRGAIASGNDWVTVDGLGTAAFNARVTLKLAMDPKSFNPLKSERDFLLVDATIKGTVDLAFKHVQENYVDRENKQIVSDFSQKGGFFDLSKYLSDSGGSDKQWVPVVMSARFEGPSGPLSADSGDSSWIPAIQTERQEKYITHYGVLSRGQYFAAGHVLIDKNRRGWPAEKIEVHIVQIHLDDAHL